MPLADDLTRAPRPFDSARGREAATLFPGVAPGVAELITGAAGCSPFLCGLMQKEHDWLSLAFDEPSVRCAAEIGRIGTVDLSDLPAELRRAKRRIALMVALADLGGAWDLDAVTGMLTDFADAAVGRAVTCLVAAEVARGKLPEGEGDAGMVVLAMGKMGAAELNYSSDIDLICLFDESRYDPSEYADIRAAFIRVTRKLTALLSDQTAEGYVFRTDLRLRPDASVTPVCLSMEAAERYYESVGRTWERAAYIKARPCAGDLAAGDRFLDALRPFVWRKHLDFAAIEDAYAMQARIRGHKGLAGPLRLEGHDLKLGRGGIREIEFFTQTRQLIAGGRDPALRQRRTVEALDALAGAGWVEGKTAEALSRHYRAHREVEHRLQMINDAQTHALPKGDEGFARLAAFMDRDEADLREEILGRIEAVEGLTRDLFAPVQRPAGEAADLDPEVAARWLTYPALRSARGVQIFERLRPQIMKGLARAARPEEALTQFDQFLRGLPAGVQLFSLFEANPQLVDLIAEICATSPALAAYLSRNSGVLDAVIGGDFFAPWPGAKALGRLAFEAMAKEEDYEARLDALRRWMKEWRFRIGVHHLQGLIDAEEAGRHYAELAEAVLSALFPVVCDDLARRHGSPPGRGAAVLGMGSLGAGRLHAVSDLDLLVIYDAPGDAISDGRKPLDARQYYARLTKALVAALSAPMAEGRLYEVDMRLRPSGRQGPVATGWAGFQSYQREEAWTWEHLALTRARPVAGSAALGAEIEAFRRTLIAEVGQRPGVPGDLVEMRARLAEAKPGAAWNVKDGAGRLQDIELFGQSLALQAGSDLRRMREQLEAGVSAGLIRTEDAARLDDVERLLWKVRAVARLVAEGAFDPEAVGEGACSFLLRETGLSDIAALAENLRDATALSAAIIDSALAGKRSVG
ncbi:glutamine-synthetase adenylyltransferase [Aestuariibius sp. 2305UL40-4]|uniref:[protein-PII] uridylyltransferase family protein n=1 Tax=Aestuariibius violaceus TaxID=3234132 RepID=UPI00345E3E00